MTAPIAAAEPFSPHPAVSILVVNWNRGQLTADCLAAIAAHTAEIAHEIVVVDNGSGRDELDILRRACAAHGARLIELNQNLYFGEANNIAAEAACGEKLLLLNNDVTVTPGYLQPLIGALDGAYAAGAVGPKFIFPDGRLQEAGAYVRSDGWAIQHGKADPPAEVLSGPGLHIVDYCSAACLLLRRADFLAAGGFDPLYDPAYFEDIDLMLRLRTMGLFSYLCGDVTVIHDENTTSRSVWDEERRNRVVAANQARFFARWGDYLGRRLYSRATPPTFRALTWSPAPPAKPGQAYIVLEGAGLIRDDPEWIQLIRSAGVLATETHVVFAADEVCSRCRILTLAARSGVSLSNFSVRRRSRGGADAG